MRDAEKSREQLIEELTQARQRVEELERLQARWRRTEEDFREKDRVLSAFHEIGRTLLSSLSQDQILEDLGRMIAEVGIFRSLMIALVDEEDHSVEVVRDFYRHPDGRLRWGAAGKARHRYSLDDANITAEVARTGKSQVIEEWDERFDAKFDTPAMRRGSMAYFIPVRHGDRVVAVLATGSPIRDRERTLQRIAAIAPLLDQFAIALDHAQLYAVARKEIAERKQAEQRLRMQALVLDQIEDHVTITDLTGVITYVNEAATRASGCSRDEMVGRIAEVYTDRPGEAGIQRGVLEKTLESGAWRGEVVSRAQDGERAVLECRTRVVRDPAGEAIALCGIATDITNRRFLESEIGRARNLESLGFLAGGIAHNFNNVLTGVVGNLSLLERLLPRESTEYEIVREAQTATTRTQELTQQLMTFARGGAPMKETTSLRRLLRQTAELELKDTRTRVRFHVDEDLPDVDMDSAQISQVICNLVRNAHQAMPRGGTLQVCASRQVVEEHDPLPLDAGHYVKVVIQDEGEGISPDLLTRIFDPYFTTRSRGHGLGLSIAHSVIQRHGGHISVTSREGEGSAFTFYLPVSPPPVSGAVVAETTVSGASTQTESDTRQRTAAPGADAQEGGARILLMDDEEVIRRTLGRALGIFGYQVRCVADGEQALEAYEQALGTVEAFDLVIMDLTVPGGMGGREAITRLLDMDPDVRVLVSSGYSHDPVITNPRDYGFVGAVVKPVGIKQLADVVSAVLATPA